jgi:hypothetical protein
VAAVKIWLRQQSDKKEGKYRVWVAEGDWKEPTWPEFDLDELVRKAFKGRVVASADHELLEKLRGKI